MKILREGDRGYALAPERGRVEIVYEYRTCRTREVEGHGQERARRRGYRNRRSSDGAGPIDAETEGSEGTLARVDAGMARRLNTLSRSRLDLFDRKPEESVSNSISY